MVSKVYIVWCKLNKSTDKFDLGVFTDKPQALQVKTDFYDKGGYPALVWISEYRLS